MRAAWRSLRVAAERPRELKPAGRALDLRRRAGDQCDERRALGRERHQERAPRSTTRPAVSGAPMPDWASVWKPWSPRIQATADPSVASSAWASRGGRPRWKMVCDRLAAARRRDQRERRAVARDPRVGHDHALRREHRAVDQALVAGLLQIVGEEPLKAGERAGAADAEDRRMIHHHGRRTAHPLEAVAVEGQVHVTHGPREGRAATGRRSRATPRHSP